MATLMDPFDALSSFQQALDAYRTSSWLDSRAAAAAIRRSTCSEKATTSSSSPSFRGSRNPTSTSR